MSKSNRSDRRGGQWSEFDDQPTLSGGNPPDEGWLRVDDTPIEVLENGNGDESEFVDTRAVRDQGEFGVPTSVYQGPIDQILEIAVRYENMCNGRDPADGLRNLDKMPESRRIFAPENAAEGQPARSRKRGRNVSN